MNGPLRCQQPFKGSPHGKIIFNFCSCFYEEKVRTRRQLFDFAIEITMSSTTYIIYLLTQQEVCMVSSVVLLLTLRRHDKVSEVEGGCVSGWMVHLFPPQCA